MRLIIPFLLTILTTGSGYAQKFNHNWAFGMRGGLNFNTSPVSAITTRAEGLGPPYYVSGISDAAGQLKLYTDGLKVWNRDHFLMPKFNNWWPWSDTVLPLVVPHVGNDSLYYLFGISNGLNANRLLYFSTKLQHAGDIEEVVYPRPANATGYYTVLATGASQLLAATAHCNGRDQWVVTHKPGQLQAFLVTAAGVSTTPVVSALPSEAGNAMINGVYSNIKFSANGEKLVLPLPAQGKVFVFRFNRQSGIFIPFYIHSLPSHKQLEDVELSADGNKLYIATTEMINLGPGEPAPDLHFIYQLDLAAGDPLAIANSIYPVNGLGDRVSCVRTCIMMQRTMQAGPDGKIYISMRYTGGTPNLDHTISVIEAPIEKGQLCRYRKNFINLGRIYRFINYNYIRSSSFSIEENGILVQAKNCKGTPVKFSLLINEIDSVKWDFGDPASGELNGSELPAPQHLYPGPGVYQVKAIIYSGCVIDTSYKEVRVIDEAAIQLPSWFQDTTVCKGVSLKLDATTAGARSYQWENGLIFPARVLDTPGRYSLTIYNDCSFASGSFIYSKISCPCDVFVPNAFTPNNDGMNDRFKPELRCVVDQYRFIVYDRWGQQVFATSEKEKSWDGKKADRLLSSGVYIWMLTYRNAATGEGMTEKGTVMLIR